jgi:hypothetical protein
VDRIRPQIWREVCQVTAVAFLATASTSGATSPTESRVLEAAKACEPHARSLLQQLVQIDSGTGDVEGLAALAKILTAELEGAGR